MVGRGVRERWCYRVLHRLEVGEDCCQRHTTGRSKRSAWSSKSPQCRCLDRCSPILRIVRRETG